MDGEDSVVEVGVGGTDAGRLEAAARTSVFERLSKPNFDERLKIPEGLRSKLDFASVVGNSNSTSLEFFPLKDKTQSCIDIPIELATKAAQSYCSTVYGYFLGPRLPFAIVQRYVKTAWSKFGYSDIMMNSSGFYFFKFNNVGGSINVVEAGPIMIRGVPLFIFPWDPTKGLVKPTHTSCPLWVKLHNIPLVAFNTEGISRIASALGIPKQMDACTASMCDKAWGRPGFAKVLIETWAVGELKRELKVVIPNLDGSEGASVNIQVEYLWEPVQCSHCLVFGHKLATCVHRPKELKMSTENKEVDAEGFTRVGRKEWRPKQVVRRMVPDGMTGKEADCLTGPRDHCSVKKTDGGKDSGVATESSISNSLKDKQEITKTVENQVLNSIEVDKGNELHAHGPPILDPKPLKSILKTANRFSAFTDECVEDPSGVTVIGRASNDDTGAKHTFQSVSND